MLYCADIFAVGGCPGEQVEISVEMHVGAALENAFSNMASGIVIRTNWL